MSRHLDYRELEPLERRVALMRAAGMSEQTIGHFIDVDYMTISAILKRPRVARYLLAIESTFANDIRAGAKTLDDAITHTANRAFVIEKEVMERLFEQKESVRAQLGAATTAQDILDRAGKRAPTKIQTEVTHTIDAEALGRVARVLQEHQAIDVTPRRPHGEALHQGSNQEAWAAPPGPGSPAGPEDPSLEDGSGSEETGQGRATG
jgi:hypothetical protein